MPLPRVVPLEEERMHELFGAAGLELQARELPFTTAVRPRGDAIDQWRAVL